MKKIAVLLLALMVLSSVAPAVMAHEPGGIGGGIMGCCFGIRAGTAYNDGKVIYWRDWIRIIPFVGSVFAIIDGVDGAKGTTTADLANKYGSIYY